MNYLVPLYAFTLFVSAFLLFSIQPLVGKYLLPLLGGGPSVWNTAMLFFQLLLLGGYAYAHGIAKLLKPRRQFYIHIALFLLAALSLPLALPEGINPTGKHPLLWQLSTMILMAAAPFFILSSTAPLLQQWFSKTSHEKANNPYFLYVASNAGSMLALLSYPIIIEPSLLLHDQSLVWSLGYGALAVMLLTCGLASQFQTTIAPVNTIETLEDDKITWKRRGSWLLLAFVPSSLMLGVTTFITTDVTTVPLFWIVPLALYLLSFIIAFSEKPVFSLHLTRIAQGIFALFILFLMMVSNIMIVWNIAIIHLLFFFFTALLCHQEMAALKPKAKHLTEFFLIMSSGGALGGIFNSLLAPLLFKIPIEYMLAILLSLFCRYLADPTQSSAKLQLKPLDWKIPAIALLGLLAMLEYPALSVICGLLLPILFFSYIKRRWIFAYLYLFVALLNPLFSWDSLTKAITITRNYYGVLIVRDKGDIRYMTHGVTNHGAQALDPAQRFSAISYYNYGSGLGDVFKTSYMNKGSSQNIGVIGLGTGSVSCYYKNPQRHFDYFEIDPNVISIAENPEYFTYLAECGSDYSIIAGDGRLMMSAQPDHRYDTILIDAFTSDNIPLHIITQQAIEIYAKKIKPDGVLVFHISNRFFKLEPELAAIAAKMGKTAMVKYDVSKKAHLAPTKPGAVSGSPSIYAVITDNKAMQQELIKLDPAWKIVEVDPDMRPWTDDYANILRALIVK